MKIVASDVPPTGTFSSGTGKASYPAGTISVTTPILGRLGDIFGKERTLVAVLMLFALGSLEFVGLFEVRGWKLAGTLVPFAYIGWSVWLLALGIGLLITA